MIATTRLTHVGFVPRLIIWPVKRGLTLVAVNTLGVVLTILTNASTVKSTMNVERHPLSIDFFVVDALVAVLEAVARFANKRMIYFGLLPFLLLKSWTARVAFRSASIVLTAAQ
jgi:hypothetical protein